MAITKRTEDDKIEVVGEFKIIQVRTATIIEENGVEISRSYSRRTIDPLVSDDALANESADVRAMASQFHTDAIKASYQASVESD